MELRYSELRDPRFYVPCTSYQVIPSQLQVDCSVIMELDPKIFSASCQVLSSHSSRHWKEAGGGRGQPSRFQRSPLGSLSHTCTHGHGSSQQPAPLHGELHASLAPHPREPFPSESC